MDVSDDQIKRIAILVAGELAERAFDVLKVRTALLEQFLGNPATTIEDLREARDRYVNACIEFDWWACAVEQGAREIAGFIESGAGI